MNPEKTGKAIAFLRKEAGYTQSALAEALAVSDKAVSKWERGLSCPDISLLPKLSVLLDTDIDSLLGGEAVSRGVKWRGVLILDQSAGTQICSKPLVYLLLQNFLLVGIKDILVIGGDVQPLLGSGERYGVKLTYSDKKFNEALLDNDEYLSGSCMVVYGNCLVYGANLTRKYQSVMLSDEEVVCMRADNGDRIPILFCSQKKWESVRHRMPYWRNSEDMLRSLQPTDKQFARGMITLPMTNEAQRQAAGRLIQVIEENEKREIANLKEIAKSRGLI